MFRDPVGSPLQEEENGNRCLSSRRDSQENYITNEERWSWKKKKKGCAQRQNCAVGLLFDDLQETKCSVGTIEKAIPLWRIAFPNVSQAADSRCVFSESSLNQHCCFLIGRGHWLSFQGILTCSPRTHLKDFLLLLLKSYETVSCEIELGIKRKKEKQ